jgi:phosphonate transport system permease protein
MTWPAPTEPAATRLWTSRPWAVLAVVAFFGWSLVEAQVDPGRLLSSEALEGMGRFLRGLVPPDLSLHFLRVVALALVRTLSIAVAGTALAVLLAFPLSILATPRLFRTTRIAAEAPGGWGATLLLAHLGARTVLRLFRAVPDLLWALLFVVAVGLGPTAGTLAIAVSYAGVLGRVFADIFEGVETGAVKALAASGGRRESLFLFAILPQAAPGLVGYTLYSLECALRAASVLGFVGAGGVGQEIQLSMRLFEYRQVSTLLLAFVAVMVAGEGLSRLFRLRFRKVQAGGAAPLTPGGTRLAYAVGLAVVLGSFWSVGLFDETRAGLVGRIARFVAALFPPDISMAFLRSLAVPLRQTLAVAGAGTLLGMVLGGVLSLPATASLVFPAAEAPGQTRASVRFLRRTLYFGARAVLAALRAIPELLWVLLCILAVGFGPFAGVLALGLHTAGVLGKLWSEALEEVPPGPDEVVEAGGGGAAAQLAWAAWPQARELVLSYVLLRWEFNVRVSALVGFLGGGGVGLLLYNSIQLGFYDRVGTLVLLVFGLVTLSDALSGAIRQTLAVQTSRRAGAAVELAAARLAAEAGITAPSG